MEEEPKITTAGRIKNPKRVEQGRRLAAISKEAKARKAAERKKLEEEECTGNANLSLCIRRRTRCSRSWLRGL